MYYYFFAYAWTRQAAGRTDIGNGNVEIVRQTPITDFGDIDDVCRVIAAKPTNRFNSVTILNYQLLRQE